MPNVILPAEKKPTSVMTYDGDLLLPGASISGPAIVEETTTTIFIPKKMRGKVDELRNLIITMED